MIDQAIVIQEVTKKRDLKRFINFPIKLYKDNPYFTPALYEDEIVNLNPKKNPASRYCDFKLFLAYLNGKIVGRIAAIINHHANKKYQQNRIRFNRIDMIDDLEVTKALINATCQYGLENGLDEITGPLGFSDQDKEGLLTYGFDQKNMFVTFYTHEYYVDHLKQLGFIADAVWNEYRVYIPQEISPKLLNVAEYAQNKYKVHLVRPKSKKAKHFAPYIYQLFHLQNRAYDHLYGYVTIPESQMKLLANQYIPMIQLDYLQLVCDENDKLVAVGVMIPSPVDALKKIKGKLYPFGFIRFLHALKTSKVLDMLLIAIEPELQNSGIAAMIFVDALKNAIKNKIQFAETGPELETNKEINMLWRSFEHKKHKQRTCFIRAIEVKKDQ